MRDGHFRPRGAQGSAERAGGVALDNDKGGPLERFAHRSRYEARVNVGVGLPGAAQFDHRKVGHSVVAGAKIGMLARKHQARTNAPREKRFGKRCKFYGFRTGPNN